MNTVKTNFVISNNKNEILVNSLSIEQWIAKETKTRFKKFWGKRYKIKPVCAETVIGDGLQLVYLSTIDQIPHYWLIRIDSKIDIYEDDFNIETILEPLEDEFGRIDYYGCSYSEYRDLKKQKLIEYSTPAVAWGGGSWGLIVNMVTGEMGL